MKCFVFGAAQEFSSGARSTLHIIIIKRFESVGQDPGRGDLASPADARQEFQKSILKQTNCAETHHTYHTPYHHLTHYFFRSSFFISCTYLYFYILLLSTLSDPSFHHIALHRHADTLAPSMIYQMLFRYHTYARQKYRK
jgi:hypothetical protein